MSAPRRTIAVVLDGPPTPAWQARALDGLRCSPQLEVTEVRLLGERPRGSLRRLHSRIERRLLHVGRDALAPVAVAAAHDGPTDAELLVWLSERDAPLGAVRDVLLLRHGRRVEPAEEALRRALLAGAGSLETDVLLRRRGEDAGETVVARTVSELRAFSLALSRDLMLWKLAALVPRAAERLPGLDRPAPAPAAPRPAPPLLALLARSLVSWPRMLATRLLFRRPWSIRVRRRAPAPTDGWTDDDERLVRWRAGSLYADPFLFEHDGRHHLFCEEVPPGAARAVIAHTELPADGGVAAAPETVLARPYHLSYPFVFAHDGELLMIPETSAVDRVELYRAVEFPHSWERDAVLLDGLDAADATLLAHDDRLWLFAGVAAPDASSLDELHLFWASSPRGPWQAHPGNPVVSDARCARPAGAIQRWGDRLVRPGQDGSRRYGGSISFREIDVLSVDEYAEHEVARLDPGDVAGARATHTYSADARFEAIDLRRRELRLAVALRSLAARVGAR